MSYFSSRGRTCVSASQAILSGLAPDGGLFVPSYYPSLTQADMEQLVDMTYPERAAKILSMYLEDYTPDEIRESVRAAYSQERFDDPAVAPLHNLDGRTCVLELFHGPTLAFKDMALQLLPHLMRQAARKAGEEREICILVATSGDTGKAALEGFRDVEGTSCVVFYPRDGVSDIQRLQMVTTGGRNTHVLAVEGNFDDCQRGVKELFESESFATAMAERGKILSSANSINFGRLVPQIVYYISAYADLLARGSIRMGQDVQFVVPTGNFGNILAGYYARCMGLPIRRLICASNRNDVLTDFFNTGIYSLRRMFHRTISPSMDILVSSNLERLLYESADRDGELVSTWMRQLRECGSYGVGDQRMEWMRGVFYADYADDPDTLQEIRDVFVQDHYLMDPHTAVASRVLRNYRRRTGDETLCVIVSTASPFKFAQSVAAAIQGEAAVRNLDAFACSDILSSVSERPVPAQVQALRTLPVVHQDVCGACTEDMAQSVLHVLK